MGYTDWLDARVAAAQPLTLEEERKFREFTGRTLAAQRARLEESIGQLAGPSAALLRQEATRVTTRIARERDEQLRRWWLDER